MAAVIEVEFDIDIDIVIAIDVDIVIVIVGVQRGTYWLRGLSLSACHNPGIAARRGRSGFLTAESTSSLLLGVLTTDRCRLSRQILSRFTASLARERNGRHVVVEDAHALCV